MAQSTIYLKTNPKIKIVLHDRKYGIHATLYENGEKIRGGYFADKDGDAHVYCILREWGFFITDFTY